MDGGKKTPITWLGLLKEKLNYLKKTTGKSVSVGEVAGEAKKEWVQIKKGLHPKYIQGMQQGKQSKKTKKMHHHSLKENTHMQEDMVMKKLIAECPRCQKKYKKMMGQKTKKNKHYQGGVNEDDDDEEKMSDNINTDIVLNGGSDEVEMNLSKTATQNNTANQEVSKDFMAATKGGDEAAPTDPAPAAPPATPPTPPIQHSTPPPPTPATPGLTPSEAAAAAAAKTGGKKRKSHKKRKSMKRK